MTGAPNGLAALAAALLLAVAGAGTAPAGAAAAPTGREATRTAAVRGLATVDSLLQVPDAVAAEAAARRLLARYGDDPGYGWQIEGRLGVALLMASRPAEALPLLEALVQRQPGEAAHHRNLGAALLQLNRRGRALSAYESAVTLSPADAELRREYGQMLLSFRDVRRAARELHLARDLCGGCPELDQPLASLHLLAQDYAAAVPYLERLYEREPTPERRRTLVAALAQAGDDSLLGGFLEAGPDSERTGEEWHLLVEAEGRRGGDRISRRLAAALTEGRVAPPPPAVAGDARFWSRIALNLLATGANREALAAVDRAIDLEPQGVVHRNNRVVILTALGRDAEARAEWARVLDLDPDRAAAAPAPAEREPKEQR